MTTIKHVTCRSNFQRSALFLFRSHSSSYSSLTVSQTDVLESLQKRAMNIIFPVYDYKALLTIHGVNTLCSRREELTRRFFLFDTCRTKRIVLTTCICYHQSVTLLQNFETRDFLKISKQIQNDFKNLLSRILLKISSRPIHYFIFVYF